MCGRFVSTNSAEEIADYFGASFEGLGDSLAPSHNVAPTDDVYAVVASKQQPKHQPKQQSSPDHVQADVRAFRWGLVPIWAKDAKIGSSMINARAETIAEKAAFKGAFKKYRCIIPMDGFYEWQAARPGGPVGANGKPVKQPMFIRRADGHPLAVAGVWSVWRDKAGPVDAPWLHTCSVITTSANQMMASIHDRMPVVLAPSKWAEWLDPEQDDLGVLRSLLVPAPDDLLTMYPVSTLVNNVRHNGDELVQPIDIGAPTE